jgi:hypothetical protein
MIVPLVIGSERKLKESKTKDPLAPTQPEHGLSSLCASRLHLACAGERWRGGSAAPSGDATIMRLSPPYFDIEQGDCSIHPCHRATIGAKHIPSLLRRIEEPRVEQKRLSKEDRFLKFALCARWPASRSFFCLLDLARFRFCARARSRGEEVVFQS